MNIPNQDELRYNDKSKSFHGSVVLLTQILRTDDRTQIYLHLQGENLCLGIDRSVEWHYDAVALPLPL